MFQGFYSIVKVLFRNDRQTAFRPITFLGLMVAMALPLGLRAQDTNPVPSQGLDAKVEAPPSGHDLTTQTEGGQLYTQYVRLRAEQQQLYRAYVFQLQRQNALQLALQQLNQAAQNRRVDTTTLQRGTNQLRVAIQGWLADNVRLAQAVQGFRQRVAEYNVLVARGGGQTPREATRLHVVFVCDRNAVNIGDGMRVNQKVMTEVVQESFKSKPERLGKWEIVPAVPKDVVQYIEHLDVAPSDSIFFYYCGHGGWDAERDSARREKGHYLAMSGGSLYRSELRNALLRKQAFSVVILTDCCSSIAGVEPPHRHVPAEWKVVHDLFFTQPGLYDIQAATRGQFGWVNSANGGYFTQVLAKWLCESRSNIRADSQDGFVSWSEFFPKLRAGTVELFNVAQENASSDADIKKYEPETPQAFYLGQAAGSN